MCVFPGPFCSTLVFFCLARRSSFKRPTQHTNTFGDWFCVFHCDRVMPRRASSSSCNMRPKSLMKTIHAHPHNLKFTLNTPPPPSLERGPTVVLACASLTSCLCISVLPNSVVSQIPSILTHRGSDTAASSPSPPPVLLTTSQQQQQRTTLHQRHHSTPLPLSLPMSLSAPDESLDADPPPPSAPYSGYQNTSPASFRRSQPRPEHGGDSPNRMLSRLFSKSFFDDFQTALEQVDRVPAAGGRGSSDLLTVTGVHERRPHHNALLLQQQQQQHYQHHHHHQHVPPRPGHVSRSNSSSVGSVRSMALVPTRTPSPLDFRTMSFRRPRSLASEEQSGGKQSATRTDSGYEKY